MTFTELLKIVEAPNFGCRVCCDSRTVSMGDCFAAIRGTNTDGHKFIPQAVSNGAAFIVAESRYQCGDAELITVADSSEAFALLAQAQYNHPSAAMTNLAVTGTNGKTTVAFLVQSVIQSTNRKCGLIGTIVYDAGSEVNQAEMTTPDAAVIARLARRMADNKTEFMMTEASSHAIEQNRLAGINFTAAAFTNITGDHLDYHRTAENYLAVKTKLFTQLAGDATAILNAESPEAKTIAEKINCNLIWYAIDTKADITAEIESMDAAGTVYQLCYNGQTQPVRTALIGKHNISNHLAAAGLCIAAGLDLAAIAKGLSALSAVPGRLEKVDCRQAFSVLVDYAHTDDALKNVLTTVRAICDGKLIVVFGCGGNRDKTKRPRMAKAAEELADIIIVTSDNPRTENIDSIIEDVIAGFTDANSSRITIEPDRKKAIEAAIAIAKKNDIVLIAGKGHEDYQIIGNEKIDFDDRKVAAELLRK
jgi:UDP-N-acetylmuramoyl-L-alanyl-D-glutamate--2,6-diaminopimelate ligase